MSPIDGYVRIHCLKDYENDVKKSNDFHVASIHIPMHLTVFGLVDIVY